jgi:hypothetical protein
VSTGEGSDVGVLELLAINAAISAACFLALWLIGIAIRT